MELRLQFYECRELEVGFEFFALISKFSITFFRVLSEFYRNANLCKYIEKNNNNVFSIYTRYQAYIRV